jgi:benzodiazapine receptor
MILTETFEKPAVQISLFTALPYLGGKKIVDYLKFPELFTLEFSFVGLCASPWRKPHVDTWYTDKLLKPKWTPPNWAFPPIWGVMSATTGYASYLIWKESDDFAANSVTALSLYASQLVLNWAWTPIFFSCRKMKWSLIDMCALLGMAGATGVSFFMVNKTAGYLFIPYVAWLSFTTALNYNIYKHNPEPEVNKFF